MAWNLLSDTDLYSAVILQDAGRPTLVSIGKFGEGPQGADFYLLLSKGGVEEQAFFLPDDLE